LAAVASMSSTIGTVGALREVGAGFGLRLLNG
jgi:hypothetical protein